LHKASERKKKTKTWVVMVQPNQMTLRKGGVRNTIQESHALTLEKWQACGYGGYHEREIKRQGNS
jgi:hypothetical protein